MSTLTNNGVFMLCRDQQGRQETITIEISSLKLKSEDVQCFEINDGRQTIKGFVHLKDRPGMDISQTGKMVSPGRYVVTVHEHICHVYGDRKVIELVKISKQTPALKPYQKSPESTNDPTQPSSRGQRGGNNKINEIQKNSQNFFYRHSNENTGGGFFDEDHNSLEKRAEVITEEKLKQFEKISDLYVDFQHWEIIVRVLDCSYKQFESKQGKMIKLLTLQLIDKAGMKIQASLFGEDARGEADRIKKGAVYRICRGQIKEHYYSQTLAQDCSKLNIILNKQSSVVEVCDIPSIPYGRDHILTLTQVLQDLNYQRYYQIEVMVLHIGEERELEKENGKKVFKRTLVVADPESRRSIECILWSRYLPIQDKWLFRSVLLKSFRLNNYRDQLSLCSVFRSEIQLLEKGRYFKYEAYVRDIEFQEVNSKKTAALKPVLLQHKNSELRTIRELQNQLMFLSPQENISSELEIWITFMRFQGKWCYGACNNPRCKRATQSFNKCVHCGTYNEQVIRKYSVPVELTDFTGSLWTTAFDDFAHEILKGYSLEEVEKLSENGLKTLAEKHLYLQFKVKISSKKETEGVVRHAVVGKPAEIVVQRALESNLIKIKRAIESQ